MRTTERLRWVLALTVAAWMLVLPAANAYIDAGSTSFIFAWVVAALATIGMFAKAGWHRIRRVFSRGGDQDAAEPVAADQE
ncbi:MAG: hypothetical protein KY469_14980 [Actinobacteria bacterium]|nr:hypothetical protein [Actinomycetota bacterium]